MRHRPSGRQHTRQQPWLEPDEIERGVGEPPPVGLRAAPSAEEVALDRERHRALLAAAAQLPGRCPSLVQALLEEPKYAYRDISTELGMPRGSIGPLRSRCLSCLRRVLAASGWSRQDLE